MFVIARHLTTERVERLRQEFVIPGLTLVGASTSAPQGFPILDPRGEPVAAVTWTIRSPGRAALAQISAKVWLALGFVSAAIGAILSVTWSNVRRTSMSKAVAEHAARHDFLTGLSNRAALVEILDATSRFVSGDDASVAILFFDLDGFKHVNDTQGHDAGDKLLQFCATKLVDLVAGRGLVARVGGDEFVILVSGPRSRDVADELAQGIIELFNGPILIDRGLAKVSASIGMAHRLGQEFSAMDLLKRADTAMYEAKKRGGNSVICYDRDVGVERKLELERAGKMRAGLGPHLVRVAYRPIVAAATEEIVGVAAEPQWRIVDQEIDGAELRRLVEENDLARPFLAAVLTRAFTDTLPWQGMTLNLRLPGTLVRTPELAGIARRALIATGFPAERLTLEIAEADIGGGRTTINDGLAQLRALGVSLAWRGFGPGQTSSGVPQDISFDEFALDPSLSAGIVKNANSQRLTRDVISIAGALEVSVTAHGVGDRDQAQLLRLAGCKRLEGPCFGPEMTADAFSRHLAVQAAGRQAEAAEIGERTGSS